MFSEWMLDNPSVDFCIGLACQWTTVRFGCGKKKSVHHKNHAEIVKGTITIDIRYIKFYMSISFIFMEGREGVLTEM